VVWLSRASNSILKVEKFAVTALVAALLLLILLNIVTRAAGAAIFWVDELAIYTMIWMALVGASAMVRLRIGVSVSLVTDLLPKRVQRGLARLVDAVMLAFALALLVLSWLWYEPITLVRSGFDFDVFAQSTFKFIYSEPTNTIGIRKFWVWLAVPLMAVDMTIHALTNLIEGPPEPANDDGEAPSQRSTA
jgi:TRAP-type C4-dicarboxylate transport system permease small subunit